MWNIGLLSARKVEEGSTVLENESVGWRLPNPNGSDRISTATETIGNNADFGIYAPVVEARTLTRGGVVYSTANTYISQPYQAGGRNFNDYGRPHTIAESGYLGLELARRSVSSLTGFTPYIVDRVLNETVTVGTETFRRSWVHTPTNGFGTDEYEEGSTFTNGIRTQYTPTNVGNVGSVIDGNGNATSFTYDWGVQQNVRTPAYPGVDTLRRAINPDGTVQSVTRRMDENGGLGIITYIYDSVFRVKQMTPAAGNATGWDATDANSAGSQFTRVTRGASFVTTLL